MKKPRFSLFEQMRFLLIMFFYERVVTNAYNHNHLDVIYFLPLIFYAWSCYCIYCKKRVKQHIIKPFDETYAYNVYPDKHKNTGLNTESNTGLNTESNTGFYTGLYTGFYTGLYTRLYTGLYTGLNTKSNTGFYTRLYNFCKKINVLLFFVYNTFKKFVSTVKNLIAKIFYASLSFMLNIMQVTVIILLLCNIPYIISHDFMCTGEDYIL